MFTNENELVHVLSDNRECDVSEACSKPISYGNRWQLRVYLSFLNAQIRISSKKGLHPNSFGFRGKKF